MISRISSTFLLLTMTAFAAPPLTTIQDVLYKADGSRFNGLVSITWKSFEAPDLSNITTQSLTVKVVNGALRVQLVPTTGSSSPVYYSVKYNSDGRVQFEETWAVPASAQPLRVRDVRVPPPANLVGNVELTTPIQQSDVIGLTADLGTRPLKGAGYLAGRVVFANSQGALESVSGSPSDCVRADGSASPCGSGAGGFVDGETPAGIVDGSNAAFSLAAEPSPVSSLAVYRNGLLMKVGQDYTISGKQVSFVAAATPQPGDTLLASYRLTGVDSGTPYAGPQVLCSGVGASTNQTADGSLGTCTIPSGLLLAGDRVEIRYALEHQGASGGFHFDVKWGSTAVTARSGGASDALVSGRADAAVSASGALVSAQSWGTALPLEATVTAASESGTGGVTIDFAGRVASSADTLSLKNFTVIRFP